MKKIKKIKTIKTNFFMSVLDGYLKLIPEKSMTSFKFYAIEGIAVIGCQV